MELPERISYQNFLRESAALTVYKRGLGMEPFLKIHSFIVDLLPSIIETMLKF